MVCVCVCGVHRRCAWGVCVCAPLSKRTRNKVCPCNTDRVMLSTLDTEGSGPLPFVFLPSHRCLLLVPNHPSGLHCPMLQNLQGCGTL